MAEITLVRHGQASYGTDDYDRLSELGHEQSRWLGGYMAAHGLKFDAVVRGALRRHRETAEGILAAAPDLPYPHVDPRFNELDFDRIAEQFIRETGSTAPHNRDGFLSTFPQMFTAWGEGMQIPGAESFDHFEERVYAGLDAVTKPGRSALIVTSGGVIGIVLRRVLGLSLPATADLLLNITNASVHRLTLERGKLRLALFNAAPHLDPEDRAHARTYI